MEAWSMVIVENLPAIACLIVGYALVVVEMWVPGFGIPGISGLILLVVGVALKAKNAAEALIIAGILAVLLIIALLISMRSIANGRFTRSKIVLNAVSGAREEDNKMTQYEGKTGIALTALRPAGMGEFAGERINVVSEGDFIVEGARVRVVKVEGNRVVVKAEEA